MIPPPSSCLSKVKSQLIDPVFEDFVAALNFDKLRVERPKDFVFFCGGANPTAADRTRVSLRHYLLNKKSFFKRVKADIVLAEQANQLYRDTKYENLIDFEADIACIATLVLVIAESAGSLAELGAFASHPTISKALRVIIQNQYYNQESFIRFGPIQLLQNSREENVGVFPWRTFERGGLIISSVNPHYGEIVAYIRAQIDNTPVKTLFKYGDSLSAFVTIYWIIHLLVAAPIGVIERYLEYVKMVLPGNLRDHLYSLTIAGWIKSHPYGGQTYYFTTIDKDPFDYRFRAEISSKDSLRWKADLAKSLQRTHPLKKHVRLLALDSRRRP